MKFPGARVALLCLAAAATLPLHAVAVPVTADVSNPTGLPLYPNLASARLDDRWRTDRLGRWCLRLAATTADSLEAVEDWYRHALRTASETDLRRGDRGGAGSPDGIKLSFSLDAVSVYRTAAGAPTSIDLMRCSPLP